MARSSLSVSAATALYNTVGLFVQGAMSLRALPNAYRRSVFDERSGRGAWDKIRRQLRQDCIWIHAASMGEIAGAAPLAAALKEQYPALSVLVTTTSLTGKAEALKRMPYAAVALLPLDRPAVIKRALGAIRPKLLLIAETEIWPALYLVAAQRDLPIVIFNGRLSDRAYPRYRRFRALFSPLLQIPRAILAQTALDAERFGKLGATQVTVTGCTKYDSRGGELSADELETLRKELSLTTSGPVIVAGSVRAGEENFVLDAFEAFLAQVPTARLIIAPRHPERFAAVSEILFGRGLSYEKRSVGAASGEAVLLLDTMGELERIYQLADICIVGGAFLPLGGHNPFEPARFAKPIIMGPHTANFRDAVAQLQRSDALVVAANSGELEAALIALSFRPDEARHLGERAQIVWQQNQGATARVMQHVTEILGVSGGRRSAAV